MVSATILAAVLAVSGSSDTTLLYFTADWCGACKSTKPAVQRLVAAGYPVREISVDREAELVSKFRVTAVPCFVLVADGREVDRVAEASSYARLVQMFERVGAAPVRQGAPAGPSTQLVRGQSNEPRAGLGLPRPLASFARNFGQRREPEQRLVEIDASSAVAPQASAAPPSAPGSFPATTSNPIAAAAPNQLQASLQPSHQLQTSPQLTRAQPAAAAQTSSSPVTGDDEQKRALQATVRLRIDDLNGHSVGTGTIIDAYNQEALIVTCGHIFRDSSGRGRIAVDVFSGGQPQTVNGTLINYDLERDLGLVAIPAPAGVKVAKVAPAGFRMERGQPVFSVGCNRGADPTVVASRISGIDRYVGSPNIEVEGHPVEGRSGGGLFSSNGQLIGVCNAADQKDNEGIFASLPAIHWELDRIGQQRIYASQEPTALAQQSPQQDESSPPHPDSDSSNSISAVAPQPRVAIQPLATAPSADDDTEVICIVRSRANPQGTEQLLVLDRPSREFLNQLASESKTRPNPELAQRTMPDRISARAPAANLGNASTPTSPSVIRAQSNDR